MHIPHWRNPNRARKCNIKYTDADYTKYYDIDVVDFEYIVSKIKNNSRLTEQENDRYGIYVLTMCLIVQANKQFKYKPVNEREDMLDQMYYELLLAIKGFNPDKGKLYSYAYRIAYVAACHFYSNIINSNRKNDIIIQHCKEELQEYFDEFNDHKTVTNDKD